MTLKELRERLAALRAEGRAKAASFDKLEAKTDRTDDDDATMARLSGEVDEITAAIEKVEGEIQALEAKRNRDRIFAGGADASQSGARPHTVVVDDALPTERRPAALGAGRSYGADPVGMQGFNSAAEFALSVQIAATGGPVDDRLLASDLSGAHTTGGANGEGFMVPPDLRDAIWTVVMADDGILTRFDPEPTARNRVESGADESTPWGSKGVQAYWRAELEKMQSSKLSTSGRDVKLEELYALVEAGEELLSDAPLLNSRLTKSAGQAIRWKAVEAFIDGDGVGKPLGFRNSKALVTVGKETGQGAGTINLQNILKIISRSLLGPYDFWMVGQDALPQLAPITIGNNPIYTPPLRGTNNMVDGGYLFGRPVILSQHSQKLGDAGDLTFVNPDGYAAYTKNSGIEFASSIHLWFDRNARAFRWIFRVGGQPHLSEPVQAAKGKPSMSHFVELGAR
jgi:HK97 family phage major capsid protein